MMRAETERKDERTARGGDVRPRPAAEHQPGNQALVRLLAGRAVPGVLDASSEVEADLLARRALAGSAVTGRPVVAGVPGGLDACTRAFFEPRFGVDLSQVRVDRSPAGRLAAARYGAEAFTLGDTITFGAGHAPGRDARTAHELAHLMRGDSAHAVSRQEHAGFVIISQIWEYAGRDVVVVATDAHQYQFFYRRLGEGDKGVGFAPEVGRWAPFDGFMPQHSGDGHFYKARYYEGVAPENPLRGFGSTLNRDIAAWLDAQHLPAGTSTHWGDVQEGMERAVRQHRLQGNAVRRPPEGPTPGGTGGGHGPAGGVRTTEAEVKAGTVEVKALGAEGAAVKTGAAELKALEVEAAALEAAGITIKATRLARLGNFLLALALPGPLDALLLFLGVFASLAEAHAKLKADFFALGLAEGLAAALVRSSPSDVSASLIKHADTPTVAERVGMVAGLRTNATNQGVVTGYRFGGQLDTKQAAAFLQVCFQAMKAQKKTLQGDFGSDDLIVMGVALKPTVHRLLEAAAEQEALRRERARREAHDWVGNKV